MLINVQNHPVAQNPLSQRFNGWIRDDNGTEWAFREVSSISKYEAIRILISAAVQLVRQSWTGELDKSIVWRSWCDLRQAEYRLLCECEDHQDHQWQNEGSIDGLVGLTPHDQRFLKALRITTYE